MKKYSLFLLILFFCISTNNIQAVHSVPANTEKKMMDEKKTKAKESRFQKMIKKVEQKAAKFSQKMEKNQFFGGVTDEPRFRMGLLLFGGGVLIRWLFGGLIGWAGAVVAVIGIVFMVLAIIQ